MVAAQVLQLGRKIELVEEELVVHCSCFGNGLEAS
jgi:hypothetical protein